MSRTEIAETGHHQTKRIQVANITHFSADARHVSAFHSAGELVLDGRVSLTSIASEFERDFIRLNRGLVVRRTLVKAFTDTTKTRKYGLATVAGVGDDIRVTRSLLKPVRMLIAGYVKQTQEVPVVVVNEDTAYDAGKTARDLLNSKSAPASLSRPLRGWWLAGWNDRDIELGAAQ